MRHPHVFFRSVVYTSTFRLKQVSCVLHLLQHGICFCKWLHPLSHGNSITTKLSVAVLRTFSASCRGFPDVVGADLDLTNLCHRKRTAMHPSCIPRKHRQFFFTRSQKSTVPAPAYVRCFPYVQFFSSFLFHCCLHRFVITREKGEAKSQERNTVVIRLGKFREHF